MIYLDSAATSLYKPEQVQYAVLDAMNSMSSPGRGAYPSAMRAAACCYDCREEIAQLFHMDDPEQVVFTFNATHALNIAIRSMISPGSSVMISGYEHNSVTRTLRALDTKLFIIDTPLFDHIAFLAKAKELINKVDAVVCTHVSNAFGYILPINELSLLCKKNNVPMIIDASQSAGIIDFNFPATGAAFAAMPGHKGLMGPQGTGILLCKNDAKPLLYGGSGSESVLQSMPDFLPDRLEAGTHNVPGIAGLLASVRYIQSCGPEELQKKERLLLERLANGISEIYELNIYFSREPRYQCSVMSVCPKNMSCEAFSEALASAGISVRAGLHCAPLAHKTVGTLDTGTVRFSVSSFNTNTQIEQTVKICKNIMKNR